MDVHTILVLDIFKVHFEGCIWVAENAIGVDVCRQTARMSELEETEGGARRISQRVWHFAFGHQRPGAAERDTWGLSMIE